MVNGVDIDPARQQTYDFSAPYAYSRTAVITSGGSTDIQTFEDLQGKRTANTMRKGEETAALREAINAALAELSQEGVLSKLSIKYFGSDISQNS